MVRIAALALVGVLMVGRADAESLNAQAFTYAFAAALTEAIPTVKVSVAGDLQLQVRYADGKTAEVNLAKVYDAYQHDPAHLKDVVRNYVATLLPLAQAQPAAQTVDRSRIVPIVKSRQWFAHTQDLLKSSGKTLQYSDSPLGPALVVVYAEDGATAVRYVTSSDDVGDRAKLYDLALTNLERLLPKVEARAGADGIFLVSAGGEYEASLLLFDGLWSGGQFKVDGDIVAAVPAKDALIVTGSHNAAGLARLREVAADLAKGPYALTAALLVYRGGKFVVFDGK